MYKLFIRPLLFLFQAETIHDIVFLQLRFSRFIPGFKALLRYLFRIKDQRLVTRLWGLEFPNPVGLAAGLDKDADVFDLFGYMGFGFVEIGTVTPRAQPGNPKPRIFRIEDDHALINRMGFNNKGVDVVVNHLRWIKRDVIIAGNIGKNKVTPNEEAINDYEICFEKLHPHVDFFIVNISSPNTPNLRELQDKEPLNQLLKRLKYLNMQKEIQRPIILKIAPDLSNEQLDTIIEIVQANEICGIAATNTTISREGLSCDPEPFGYGGLSGKPLKDRATEVIRYIAQKTGGKLPIIGVGGIMTPEDALEKLDAGASLVQLYTGFIYEGPALVREINKKILERLPAV